METGKWSFFAKMTSPRREAASVVVQDTMYIFGGVGSTYLSSAEKIDANGVVTAIADMPRERYSLSAVALPSGKILIMGGGPTENFKSTMEYDPTTDSYDDTLPDMTSSRSLHGCTIFNSQNHGGRPVVLCLGGSGNGNAELYDYTTADAVWTTRKISLLSGEQKDNTAR